MTPIEKNIPLPEDAGRGRAAKYPWRLMEIGDSFLFPSGMELQPARNISCAAAKRLGRQFVVRKTDGGLRCWRFA